MVLDALGHSWSALTPCFSVQSPGFWSRLKEKGSVAKDIWGVVGSACANSFCIHPGSELMDCYFFRLSVQQTMQDIERAQLKGDTSEEELKALEFDVTGKIMLASWRGTRFEVVQVLREVSVNVTAYPPQLMSIPSHTGCRQRAERSRRDRPGAVQPRAGSPAPRRDLQKHRAGRVGPGAART